MTDACAHHIMFFPNDYIAWHHEAARRQARGQRQTRCPKCLLWLFSDEWGDAPTLEARRAKR